MRKQIEQELRSEKEAEMVKQRDDFAREIDNAKVKLQADIGIQVQQLKDQHKHQLARSEEQKALEIQEAEHRITQTLQAQFLEEF